MTVSTIGDIFANAKFSKGELTLLPIGNVVLVPKEKVGKTAVVLHLAGWKFEHSLVVSHSKCNFEKGAGSFCLFFWCRDAKEEKSKDDKDAIAEKATLHRATVKHQDLTIPCMKNKGSLQVGSLLLVEPLEDGKKKRKT